MPLIASRLALTVVALLLSVPASYADATSSAASSAAPTVTLDQVTAVIVQMGFTPLDQPQLSGTVFRTLARLGNNAFMITVDAMTGQFLAARPADAPLPPTAPAPASPSSSAMASSSPPTTQTSATTPVLPATKAVSPVMRAANLARAKGFRVLSFKHIGDDTFLVGQKGNALFQLKVDDDGKLLSVTPIDKDDDD